MTSLGSSPPIILPDRFELDREIGRGGMAVVYRAQDRHLGRFVAIKVLSADLSNTVGAERFQREIALMAKLVHPGIVALFDSGESAPRRT
jgi:eukaryotic-like serine/threonine-protein kinase